ncbi:MAG: hypothetical protein RR765_11740 [Peptostreptococcaceae bacterium]
MKNRINKNIIKKSKEIDDMEKINKIIGALKNISRYLLVNERINSQRCVAKDIDTTKTILEAK